MLVIDSVTFEKPRLTSSGYMVIDARVARTGVQTYSGKEIGKPDLDVVRMFRSAEEVFHQDALASFTHKPVTRGHPSQMVDASNWKQHAIGMTGDSVVRDGHFVRLPFTLMDQASINAVNDGERELSNGYVCEVDWTPGVSPDGEAYDAVQRNIRGNHLAVVPRGRAGSECRIGDSWEEFRSGDGHPDRASDRHAQNPKRKPVMELKKLLVDGITIDATEQSAQAIERLQSKLSVSDAALNTAKTEHLKALEGKDGVIGAMKATHATELQAKDGEIAALKSQVPDDAALDARAEARSALIDQAKTVLGSTFDPRGKSDSTIQREVVRKALGDSAKDMSDAEIGGAFKVVAARPTAQQPVADPLRRVLADARPVETGTEGKAAYDAMIDRMTNGWQIPAQQGAR